MEFAFFYTLPAASLAAHHSTGAGSGEMMQSLTGSLEAVVTAKPAGPDKGAASTAALLQSRE